MFMAPVAAVPPMVNGPLVCPVIILSEPLVVLVNTLAATVVLTAARLGVDTDVLADTVAILPTETVKVLVAGLKVIPVASE